MRNVNLEPCPICLPDASPALPNKNGVLSLCGPCKLWAKEWDKRNVQAETEPTSPLLPLKREFQPERIIAQLESDIAIEAQIHEESRESKQIQIEMDLNVEHYQAMRDVAEKTLQEFLVGNSEIDELEEEERKDWEREQNPGREWNGCTSGLV